MPNCHDQHKVRLGQRRDFGFTTKLSYSRENASNKSLVVLVPWCFGRLPWSQNPIAVDFYGSIGNGTVHRCRHRLSCAKDDLQCLIIGIEIEENEPIYNAAC